MFLSLLLLLILFRGDFFLFDFHSRTFRSLQRDMGI